MERKRIGNGAKVYRLNFPSEGYVIFLDTRADIVQFGQQRTDNALRILLFIELKHSHVATALAEAAKKQKNVFNAEIGVSEHTHALLHVLQNVERHRRPGIRCNEKEK